MVTIFLRMEPEGHATLFLDSAGDGAGRKTLDALELIRAGVVACGDDQISLERILRVAIAENSEEIVISLLSHTIDSLPHHVLPEETRAIANEIVADIARTQREDDTMSYQDQTETRFLAKVRELCRRCIIDD